LAHLLIYDLLPCIVLCFALNYPLSFTLVYERNALTREDHDEKPRQLGSYLDVEHAGLGNFADVFAAGDLVQAVEL
jgi:hypothetical protein